MSNVIPLRFGAPAPKSDPLSSIIASFAQDRRPVEDVFWLKENAELLGILNATGAQLPAQALAPFEAFYARLEERFGFFPQYYRFLLSICLDLEDLGMPGDVAQTLCAQTARAGLPEAELSDLQRAEARRLLARRGAAKEVAQGALGARLHRFLDRSATFALPNKKAAYELTHIVFYLSEYGQRDPQLSDAALTSLTFAGLLAYLEQNMDLLAEVCLALRFAGQRPSPIWEDAVCLTHRKTVVMADEAAPLNDHYHAYFVTGWAADAAGKPAFHETLPRGSVRFMQRDPMGTGVLRVLSSHLLEMGPARTANWSATRRAVAPMLGQAGHAVLDQAEASCADFETFFEGFARAASAT